MQPKVPLLDKGEYILEVDGKKKNMAREVTGKKFIKKKMKKKNWGKRRKRKRWSKRKILPVPPIMTTANLRKLATRRRYSRRSPEFQQRITSNKKEEEVVEVEDVACTSNHDDDKSKANSPQGKDIPDTLRNSNNKLPGNKNAHKEEVVLSCSVPRDGVPDEEVVVVGAYKEERRTSEGNALLTAAVSSGLIWTDI